MTTIFLNNVKYNNPLYTVPPAKSVLSETENNSVSILNKTLLKRTGFIYEIGK